MASRITPSLKFQLIKLLKITEEKLLGLTCHPSIILKCIWVVERLMVESWAS
jgi:hypothetical protein